MDDEDSEKEDVLTETITSYRNFKKYETKILDFSTYISKNIYNTTIYCTKIFYLCKDNIISDVCDKLNNITNYENMMNITLDIFKYYYDNYKNILKKLTHNNKIIYEIICEKIESHSLNNDNFFEKLRLIVNELEDPKYNLKRNNKFDNIIFYNIVFKIFKSFYDKNFNNIKNKIAKNIKITNVDKGFIEQVRYNEYLFEDSKSDYQKKFKIITDHFEKLKEQLYENKKIKKKDRERLEKQLNINAFNQHNIIKRFTYIHLNINTGLLSSDLVCNIINNALNGFKSFWNTKNKGLKSKMPNFLDKDGHYILEFYKNKGFKIIDDEVILTLGNTIGNTYLDLLQNKNIYDEEYEQTNIEQYKNIIKLDKYHYIDKKFVILEENKEYKPKSYKIVIKNKKYYILKNNIHIIDGRRLKIKLPKILKGKNLKYISLQPLYNGFKYKINFVYDFELDIEKNINKIKEKQQYKIDMQDEDKAAKKVIELEEEINILRDMNINNNYNEEIYKKEKEQNIINEIYKSKNDKNKIQYEYINESKNIIDNNNKMISIDTGMVNLMTIYDPNGEQYIIKGSVIIDINRKYNSMIDYYTSIAKRINNKNTTNRIHRLFIKREQEINRYFNNVVEFFVNTYVGKIEKIIIGYNKGWKKNVNMGRKNNRKFYNIPYKKIIDKMIYTMKKYNIEVINIDESYTSKCDALAFEKPEYHNEYKGKRLTNKGKRGLFSSSKGVLINSDLNGAINIMRKYIIENNDKKDLKKITGINLLNPKVIKI